MLNNKTPIIIGNWKSNISDHGRAAALATGIRSSQKEKSQIIGICPSYIHLFPVKEVIGRKKILLGAQNISPFPLGNHTGETTAEMLLNVGVTFVILGHIERRAIGETNEDVNSKVKTCLKNKITPIICIGEIDPKEKTKVLKEQVLSATKSINKEDIKKLIFAYEPVSFIGKNKASGEENIFRSVLYIRSLIAKKFDKKTAFSFPILYGGSVNVNNAKQIFEKTDVNGFLIGGASLKANSFNSIIRVLC